MDCYENPTSQFADILLSAASLWESEALGLYNWRDRDHAQVRGAVVAPKFERKLDIEVIFASAERLGLVNSFFNGDLVAAFDDQPAPLHITFAELRELPMGLAVPLTPRYCKYA